MVAGQNNRFMGFPLLLRHCLKGCSMKGRLLTIKRNFHILAPDAQRLHYSLITASMLQTGLHNENHLPFKVQQDTRILSCPFILNVCFSHYKSFWLLQFLELSAPCANWKSHNDTWQMQGNSIFEVFFLRKSHLFSIFSYLTTALFPYVESKPTHGKWTPTLEPSSRHL